MEIPLKVRGRRGPKPKPLAELAYKPRDKPVTASRRSYPRHRKIEILKFLLHHRVPVTPSLNYQKPRYRSGLPPPSVPPGSDIEYRAVTIQEASEFWKIPNSTIQKWWAERDIIFAPKEKKERKNASKHKRAQGNTQPSESSAKSDILAPPALSEAPLSSEPSAPLATSGPSASSEPSLQPQSPQNGPSDIPSNVSS